MKLNCRTVWICMLTIVLILGADCKSKKSMPSINGVGYSWGSDANQDTGSLFSSDQAVLSNEDIARILSTPVTLPETARMAVMQLGQNTRYWSESSPVLGQQTTESFLAALRQCPRIAAATALPGILIPERHTVPYLREAAARYQADLLLIYRQNTGSYEKYRATQSDQVKAYCTVEAALLDVRSGTVPFTTVGFEEVRASKAKEDLSFDETVDKAYHEAESKALQEVAASVTQFLGSLGTTATVTP
ncbi:MAG: hypothetical protein IT365_20895 [Candidatus Hydrogenedentes bacterium]|nr:hypothetical protein [Candidatus Hydrogenedentota bacterium]